MKLMLPFFSAPICFEENILNSVVIENQKHFREIVNDIRCQIDKSDGDIVFSKNDTPLNMAGNVEIISEFLELDLNCKNLLSKVQNIMEKTALDEQHYMETQEILASIEHYVHKLSFSCPCDVECGKLTVSNLLKMTGLRFAVSYRSHIEKLLDYMSLVRDLDRDKLFIFINMRSWFTDEEMELFVRTVLAHKYQILLMDNCEYPKLEAEKRVIIDRDLCEI